LLSLLQHLTQLTRLYLGHSLTCTKDATPPAAAYAAPTSSTKLQSLNISKCRLPAGVWQHMFPAGRRLPHLRTIDASHVEQPAEDLFCAAPAPNCAPLVSCCPGLQVLLLAFLQYSAGQLVPLQGLRKLRVLTLQDPYTRNMSARMLEEVCHLTGLQSFGLGLREMGSADGQLLQLTKLQQLTRLKIGPIFGQVSRVGGCSAL
jgi:hypothetical protein